MPEGFEFVEKSTTKNKYTIHYSFAGKDIIITQFPANSYSIDTEDAMEVKYTTINDSQAIISIKEDKTSISWRAGETMLWVRGNITSDELIKIAESVKIFK